MQFEETSPQHHCVWQLRMRDPMNKRMQAKTCQDGACNLKILFLSTAVCGSSTCETLNKHMQANTCQDGACNLKILVLSITVCGSFKCEIL